MLIDADGVADVPVEVTVLLFIPICLVKPSFLTSITITAIRRISTDKLPENAEATQSVVQATLTEGAIRYRKFAVISGQKAMALRYKTAAILRLAQK